MAGLRERLQRVHAPMAIVMAPRRTPLLRSPVNMQLLRRHTEQNGQRVIVVTPDGEIRDLARRYGVPVYAALSRVPRRLRGDVSDEELSALPRLPGAPFYRYLVKLGFAAVSLAVLAAAIAVVGALAIVLTPRAVITVQPAAERVSVTMDLLASAQFRVVDSAQGQFPAKPVQVVLEQTGQVTTTGTKRAPDAFARGAVVFANRSQNPLTIPKGTIVRTGTGATIRFVTEEDAALPGGAYSTARVPIKALEAGPTGNVKAGAISVVEGPLSFQVSAINDEDTSGGSDKQMRYVTLQDRATLRENVVQRMRTVASNELRKALGADDILPEETLSITVNEVVYDKALDAEGETLSGKVRATVSGLYLDGDILRQIAERRLMRQIPANYDIVPGSIRYGAPSGITVSDGVISLRMSVTGLGQARLSALDVQRAAAGKTMKDAAAAIAGSFPLERPPEIDLRDSRLGRLPFLTSRISVRIVEYGS